MSLNYLSTLDLNTQLDSLSSVLSSGEKQLLSLARAILKNKKILVMDEATSNIDNVTEEKIQSQIKTSFKNSTGIIIAHKLRTVIELNTIVIMDKGHIIEMESPKKLLQNPSSEFYKFFEQCPKEEQNFLMSKLK